MLEPSGPAVVLALSDIRDRFYFRVSRPASVTVTVTPTGGTDSGIDIVFYGKPQALRRARGSLGEGTSCA